MAPTEGPKQTPVSNDINSLASVVLCCLGHIWWPLWWPRVGPMVDKPDPRCATSSVNLKLTHCFPTISLFGYLGRPPRGPPKRTLFETQREYLLLLSQSSQAPTKALLKRSHRGLLAYFFATSCRSAVGYPQFTVGRSVCLTSAPAGKI